MKKIQTLVAVLLSCSAAAALAEVEEQSLHEAVAEIVSVDISENSIVLDEPGRGKREMRLAHGVKIFRDGEPMALAGLRKADFVSIVYQETTGVIYKLFVFGGSL